MRQNPRGASARTARPPGPARARAPPARSTTHSPTPRGIPAPPLFLEFLQTITGVFVVVYDGQHALKFTLGRARYVVGPGVHWKWPIVQRFQVQSTKHTTLDLEPQVIQLADDLVYEVDAKVLYQVVDLLKAIIEIDDLVTGLQNRVVLAIQRVVSSKTRDTIRDTEALIRGIREELRPVEDQWGVKILQLGFSNLSPSPASLEITQLDLLARERQVLYRHLAESGLPADAAVALVTGAVVTTHPTHGVPGLRDERRALAARAQELAQAEEGPLPRQVQEAAPEEGGTADGGPAAGGERPPA
jgi:regulator of protease activity HflC (stomatin/prohibitin superfamily)